MTVKQGVALGVDRLPCRVCVEPGKRPLDPVGERQSRFEARHEALGLGVVERERVALVAEELLAEARVNGGDCLGRNVHDVRLEARGRGDHLRDLIPRQPEVRREVEAVGVPERRILDQRVKRRRLLVHVHLEHVATDTRSSR